MAVIGYARVSTEEQNLDLQRDALKSAGCAKVFEDLGVSATARVRPGFEEALASLKPGDTFVVWKLDRGFRSLLQALTTLERLEKHGISFVSLTESQIDTKSPLGRCLFAIGGALAELERGLISERTRAGMAAAKRRGRRIGRPRKLDEARLAHARRLLNERQFTIAMAAQEVGVSSRTLHRSLADSARSAPKPH